MTKTRAKNSAEKRNKTADALQKVRIKNKTEWTGFPEMKTKEPLKISNELKNVFKNSISVSFEKSFLYFSQLSKVNRIFEIY